MMDEMKSKYLEMGKKLGLSPETLTAIDTDLSKGEKAPEVTVVKVEEKTTPIPTTGEKTMVEDMKGNDNELDPDKMSEKELREFAKKHLAIMKEGKCEKEEGDEDKSMLQKIMEKKRNFY